MTGILLAIVSVLLLGSLIAIALLWRQRGGVRAEIVASQRLLEAERSERQRLLDHERTGQQKLSTALAVAEQKLTSAQTVQDQLGKLRIENIELAKQVERFSSERDALTNLHKKIDDSLASVATRSLSASGEQFLQLARKTFEKDQATADAALAQRQVAIEALVGPIRERLEKATAAIDQVEKTRLDAYAGLRQQLVGMVEDQRTLRDETANLVKALRRPEVRGQWGEMQLKRVAELAGMVAHCDFSEQTSVSTEAGTQRPDMIVSLPGGRQIVIDAKTPLRGFIDAFEADDEPSRKKALEDHVRHIETKVNELGSKRYQEQFNSPDFVVLFIPGESFLYAAAQQSPKLIESAMNRNVVIATPTTLISLLKVVALGWREEQLAQNAREIRDLGQELHKRIATLTGHLEKLGKAVGGAVEHYNKFVGSFESQVLVQARRFTELKADSSKELPAEGKLEPVQTVPRLVAVDADVE